MCFPVFLKMPSSEFTPREGLFQRTAAAGSSRRHRRSYRALVFERQRLPAGGSGEKGLLETLERDAGEIEFRGFEG